jgi:hypothetical protein
LPQVGRTLAHFAQRKHIMGPRGADNPANQEISVKRILATSAVMLVLSAAASGVHAQQLMRPEPMDPDAPIAQRVAGVVRLLLEADTDAAISHVREHAAAEFTADAISEIVRAIMGDAASHGRDYNLEAVAPGPENDFLAMLRHRDGGPPLPIIFQIEPDAPHRIVAIRRPGGLRIRAPGEQRLADAQRWLRAGSIIRPPEKHEGVTQ